MPRSLGSESPPYLTPAERVSAFSLVNQSLAARGMIYGNPLSPLVPVAYPPYIWPHLSSLFLPYSNPLARHPESLSPERASSVDNGYTPEKAQLGKKNQLIFYSRVLYNMLNTL